LSVHPANLLPLCKVCNSDIKGEKDPLAHATITDTFIPYRRFARPEMRLAFQDDGQGGYSVSLQPANDDPVSTSRVRNFDELFELSRRWSRAMGEISEIAVNRAREYIEARRDGGWDIDVQNIPAMIDTTCVRMERNWGNESYEYIATEWLRWANIHKPALLQMLATV